ncbi:hypothetical protein BDB01DRAFT_805899 [Pilobolus umbonatus]|nr:hypothetical protein BDB01DRAFT_805899 [Pilobolus umbonatus]
MNDTYLVSHMDQDLYVPIHIIADFKRIRESTNDIQYLVTVLRQIPSVVVDEAGTRVRPNISIQRRTVILRDIPDSTPQEIQALLVELDAPTAKEIKKDINNMWYITFGSEDDALKLLIGVRGKYYKGEAIAARMKSEPILRVPSSLRAYQSPSPTDQIPHQQRKITNQISNSQKTQSTNQISTRQRHSPPSSSTTSILIPSPPSQIPTLEEEGEEEEKKEAGYYPYNTVHSGYIQYQHTNYHYQSRYPKYPVHKSARGRSKHNAAHKYRSADTSDKELIDGIQKLSVEVDKVKRPYYSPKPFYPLHHHMNTMNTSAPPINNYSHHHRNTHKSPSIETRKSPTDKLKKQNSIKKRKNKSKQTEGNHDHFDCICYSFLPFQIVELKHFPPLTQSTLAKSEEADTFSYADILKKKQAN